MLAIECVTYDGWLIARIGHLGVAFNGRTVECGVMNPDTASAAQLAAAAGAARKHSELAARRRLEA